MQYFIADDPIADIYTLSPEESKHCIKVLRMTTDDQIFITDGNGTLCTARIINADPKECTVQVINRQLEYHKRNHFLHIAVAVTKNTARIEWFIEKAVEIGIDEITLLTCDHSERTTQKTDRLEKIITSAMKQSLKTYRPLLNGPTTLIDFLNQPFNGCKMICYCEGNNRNSIHQIYSPHQPALILIGPEGDFSPHEIETALNNGYQPVTLGTCRLRTETAALYATTAINFINEI